jgi:hypothetical protein
MFSVRKKNLQPGQNSPFCLPVIYNVGFSEFRDMPLKKKLCKKSLRSIFALRHHQITEAFCFDEHFAEQGFEILHLK